MSELICDQKCSTSKKTEKVKLMQLKVPVWNRTFQLVKRQRIKN